jgi:hypothetical protein
VEEEKMMDEEFGEVAIAIVGAVVVLSTFFGLCG